MERGAEIKAKQEELERIKNSNSYRLARALAKVKNKFD